MRPYNVEVFTQNFEMVANTNVNDVTYKEDYLSSDENTITVFTMPGIAKQERTVKVMSEWSTVCAAASFSLPDSPPTVAAQE